MPYFGLTSAFLSSPLFKNSVRLTPVSVCAMLRFRCAAYSGLTVRHTPVFARTLMKENQPQFILSFGAFSYEFGRRTLGEEPTRNFDYWGAVELGNEFSKRMGKFNLGRVNLLPLLHRSIAGGYFLSAHRDFCQQEGANYFDYVGEKIAEQLLKHRLELPIWII